MCQERGETGSKRDAQSSLSAAGGGAGIYVGVGRRRWRRRWWGAACVSVPYGRRNQGPPSRWLKTREMHSPGLEARCSKARCQQDHPRSEISREGLPLACPASGGSEHSWRLLGFWLSHSDLWFPRGISVSPPKTLCVSPCISSPCLTKTPLRMDMRACSAASVVSDSSATPWTAAPLSAGLPRQEWAAISSSRGSPRPRDRTCVSFVSCIGRWILYHCASWENNPARGKHSLNVSGLPEAGWRADSWGRELILGFCTPATGHELDLRASPRAPDSHLAAGRAVRTEWSV